MKDDRTIKYTLENKAGEYIIYKQFFDGDTLLGQKIESVVMSEEAAKERVSWLNSYKETWYCGADTTELDSECPLSSIKPCKECIDCPLPCSKSNCGAVLYYCSTCGVEYFDPPGCWQYGHNNPTACDCQ